MRDKPALNAAAPPTIAALPLWLDRAAFGLLILLGVCFAVEFREPLLRVGGLAFTNVEVLMMLIFVAWLGSRTLMGQLPSAPRALIMPLVVWLIVLALSTIFAPAYQREAVLFMGRTLVGVLIGWAAYDVAHSEGRGRGLCFALAGGGALVAIMGLLEASQLSDILRWLLHFKAAPTQVGDVTRISSTLSYATIAAMVLELTLPIMLALWITTPHRRARIALGAAILITLAALVLTLSRAGILSMGAALAVVIAYGVMKHQHTLIRAAAITGVALLLLVVGVMMWNPVTMLRLSTETEAAWYQAHIEAPDSVQMRPREVIEVPITLTNTSVRTWSASGEKAFMLSYHLLDADGELVSWDGARTLLTRDVTPDQTITLQALIAAPDEAGQYRIEWDMLQDTVSWFSWKGAAIAPTHLTIEGAPVAGHSIRHTQRPTNLRLFQPTPTRFELWSAALQMTRDYPLLGVGPDNFRWQYGEYANLEEWNTDIHANNLYLEWLADTGILGVAAFVWLSATLLIYVVRGVWQSSNVLALGLLASLIAWYVHGVFDAFIEFTPTYVAFWLIVGSMFSLLRGAPRDAHRV